MSLLTKKVVNGNVQLLNRKSLTIRVGYDNNDLSSGTCTAIADHRGTLAIFDVKALVTGKFCNNKAALETA